jgi:hypothetical protein
MNEIKLGRGCIAVMGMKSKKGQERNPNLDPAVNYLYFFVCGPGSARGNATQ